MPSGRVHDRLTLWSLPWVVGLTLLLTRKGSLTLIVAGAFLFSGLMFGPDLDIVSVQFKRWGSLRLIWLPYQKLLRHRSFLSHGLVIGTALRLLYLLSWIALAGTLGIALAQLIWGFHWNWQQFSQRLMALTVAHSAEAIALFLGLELGAMLHSGSDWLTSAYKRSQKLKKQKSSRKRKRNKSQK